MKTYEAIIKLGKKLEQKYKKIIKKDLPENFFSVTKGKYIFK